MDNDKQREFTFHNRLHKLEDYTFTKSTESEGAETQFP